MFIGQIANLTGGEGDNKSPLAKEIDDFVKIISSIAIVTALIFFGVGIGTSTCDTPISWLLANKKLYFSLV